MLRCFIHLLLILGMPLCVTAQQSDSLSTVSPKYFDEISAKASHLEQKLDRQTDKTIGRLQKQEEKMKRRLARKDSLKAEQVFGDVKARYGALQQKLATASSGNYIPSLDSMETGLKFLQENPTLLKGIRSKAEGLGQKAEGGQVAAALDKVNGLKEQLGKAENLQQFIRERKEYFKNQLGNLGFTRELKKLNKQAYYYSQQLAEYKSMLKDHKKATRKALELLSRTKLFKDFIKKNSGLASLFRLPGDPGDPASQTSLAGLQTRAQVSGLIGQQLAAGGPDAQAQLQQNLQQAQGQLNELKNKINQLGGGGSEADMPEGFKPNTQRTKSFWQKWQLGADIQSTRGSNIMPVSSDLALSAGFKSSDKFVAGLGVAGRIGWGQNIRNISLSYSGIGLRSFAELKLKGSFHAAAGYELNYRPQIRDIQQLKDRSGWQPSGLIGLSKQVSLKTKLFKQTSIKLLWDFLSYQQVPRTQPILFRVGYNF